jgi:hypothetical protein
MLKGLFHPHHSPHFPPGLKIDHVRAGDYWSKGDAKKEKTIFRV